MRGYGRGRGWGSGAAGGGGWADVGPAVSPTGYRYIGGCRCGFGPNAYYQDSAGSLVPAASLFAGATPRSSIQPASDVERLRAEKADLERRLRDLEDRLG